MEIMDRVRRFVPAIACLALAVVLAGCPSDGGRRGSGQLRRIDIVGAQALMVAPANQVARAGRAGIEAHGTGNVLFKQVGGEWMRVRMMDEYGHEVQTEAPLFIDDMTDRWVYMIFPGGEPNPWVHSIFLVCKQTGAAFDITPIGRPWGMPFGKPNPTDGAGNIYARIGLGLVKISLGSAGGEATRITPNESEFFVHQFAVDYSGNVLYSVGIPGIIGAGGGFHAVRTAAGTVVPLNAHAVVRDRPGILFTGLNREDIHFLCLVHGEQDEDGSRRLLYRMRVREATAGGIDFLPVDVQDEDLGSFEMNDNRRIFHFPDRLLVVGNLNSTSGAGMLILPENDNPRLVPIYHGSEPFSFTDYGSNMTLGSGEIFAEYGGSGVLAIDTETGASRAVVPDDGVFFQRFILDVTANDIIILDTLDHFGVRRLIHVLPNGQQEVIRENVPREETITLTRVR